MDDISDQELRRRLSAFNTVVPPVTKSTRNLLLKKLANLESSQLNQKSASDVMPPPKLKSTTNGTNESIIISSSGTKTPQHNIFDVDSPRKSTRLRRQYRAPDTFDTSDSEVDTHTLGHSIAPPNPKIISSSPKSNETSLMNVSNWKNETNKNIDESSHYLPKTEQFEVQTDNIITSFVESKVNKTPSKTPIQFTTMQNFQKDRMSPFKENKSHADQAIQRWKEKIMDQSHSPLKPNLVPTNTALFNSPSPILKPSTHNLRKNVRKSTLSQFPRNYYTMNIQNLILLIIGFFTVILGLYFISLQPSTVVLPSGILNSLCAKKNLQGSNCEKEQEKVQRLYNSLVSQVQDKYVKNQCDKLDVEPTVDGQSVYDYISTHENIPPREIEELVELFKSIAKTYSDSPIGFSTSFNINVQPNLPILCAVKNIFSNMFYLAIWFGIVGLSVIGLYFLICYISSKSEKHHLDVNQLIENTIDLLKEQAQNRPDENYLPIIHIRDRLIPFNERQGIQFCIKHLFKL
ncbi:Hypothetical protein CINCED_3A018232 [Cinara cedri]|uniref:LEM domain-containing protein n=1 Tax=Cinara cedri TaxID=506608 RepID=A0A5E4MF63_9HEMI|nr:Hypothetical protein CINCED_3A018232 [Cinara cedri]